MKILVTGTAGFIGSHLAHRLLDRGDEIIGVDNVNDYYDVNLKEARLKRLTDKAGFTEVRQDVADRAAMEALFAEHKPERVVHLAAQAGVRYSIENPHAYVDANLVGFMNILEGCRHNKVKHLVYASSSSVYGANETMPFSVHDNVDHPLSLYAASKKANELMAHTYSHLYNLPTTGLRFFTVYGPWGRPDMALFLFVDAIVNKKPIKVFNHGDMQRDFTYIDDIISGILAIIKNETGKRSLILNPYKIYNIGNNKSVSLMEFIDVIEKEIGLPVERKLLPLQPGDMAKTWADSTPLLEDYGYKPSIDIKIGIKQFINWYKNYYNIPNK